MLTDFDPRRLVRLDDDDDDDEEHPEDPKKGDQHAAPGPYPLADRSLYKSRTVLIFGEITMTLAKEVSARMLAMAHESDKPIRLVINSPGGHVEAGDTVHDMIKFVGVPVKVLGTGWVASAGALIYLGADKENRFCLPNTRFLLHQPMGGMRGAATDIDIEAREIVKMRARINRLISETTGQPLERVERDTDRNFWMNADEAREYGIVHKIVRSRAELG